MLDLTDPMGYDLAESDAAARVWMLVSGLPSGIRERLLFMVLQACIDDSGGMDEDVSPSFVLGGFIAEAETWANFSTAWDEALQSPPSIKYFKMVEATNHRGQFANWEEDKINDKIKTLVPIITQYAAIRVSVSVDKGSFARHLRSLSWPTRNHNTDKPYCLAFQRILLEVPKMQLLHSAYFGSRPRPVDYIFDDQGEIGLEAQSTWLMIKRLAERLAQQGRTDLRPCLGAMPRFDDEKRFPPLQAADLYAWNVRRFFYNDRQPIVTAPLHLKALVSIPPIHAHLDDTELAGIRFGAIVAGAKFSQAHPDVNLLSYQGSKTKQKKNRAMKRGMYYASKRHPPSK